MMPNIKPIPVMGEIDKTKVAVSSNNKYSSCITKKTFGKKLTIINNETTYYAHKSPKHFQYNFPWKTKVHAMQFNGNSDKLFCLTERGRYSEVMQFGLEASDSQPDNKWKNQRTISIFCNPQHFLMDDINDKLSLVYFKDQELINSIINTETNEITTISTRNSELITSNIKQLQLNTKSMQIYATLQDESLITLSQENSEWQIKHVMENCPNLPNCYSDDGSILVFVNNSKIQIRLSSPEHNGEAIQELDLQDTRYDTTVIKNIAVNSSGEHITVIALYTYKNQNLCYYNIKKTGRTWLKRECTTLHIYAGNSLAFYHNRNVALYHINETDVKVLVNYNEIQFSMGKPMAELKIPNRAKLTELNRLVREANRRRYEYERRQEAINSSHDTGLFSNDFISSFSRSFSSGSYDCNGTSDYSGSYSCSDD